MRCTPPSGRARRSTSASPPTRRRTPPEAAEILADLGTPLLIHQPSYSMLNRWIETEGLLDVLEDVGAGCIAFSPLAQGMLTDKYLNGVPEGSRASQDKSLSTDLLTDEALGHVRALNDIAGRRGQSLAQMALAWALRDPRVTTVLVGASSVRQLEQNVGALDEPRAHRRRARRHRRARRRHGHRPVGGAPRRGLLTRGSPRATHDGRYGRLRGGARCGPTRCTGCRSSRG